MATGYKYAERNAANQVDWSAIGSSISKTLTDERERREKAKKEIADASNQYAETLSNAPMGESRDFNDWTLDFASNAQEFRLMQDRMLRSGRMKLRDYNMSRQNLKSGTEQAFNLAKEYNAEYADKMKRLQDGESQDLEGFLMGTAEGFSNFTKSGLYIDPNTGKVAIANKVQKTLPDGTVIYEMSQNPNDFTSINSLRNRITSKYNKFNVSKSLQPGVSDLGKRIEVIMKDGVKTREDAKQTPGYITARDTFINSFVDTNPDNVTSILTDTLAEVVTLDENGKAVGTGKGFKFTFDPNEAESSEEFILLRENPQTGRIEGDFDTANGKKQKEMARKFLETKFDTMVDFEETARQEFAPQRPTATDKTYARTLRKNADLARDITDVLTNPNAEDVQAGLGILREYGLNIRGSAKTPTGLNFEVYNKNTKKYEDVPVIIDKEDTSGSVERVLQKLLGRDVDVNEVMNQLPENFFEGKNITDIESLFAPEEVVQIKEVDSRQNVMMDPLQEDLTQPKPVTVDSQIKKLEDGTVDEQEEVTTVLSEVLKQQGIDDVDVQFTTTRTGSGRRGRQVTTVDITSKYFEQPYKVLLSEFQDEIRTIIQDITNKRKSQMTFGGEPTVQGNETAPSVNISGAGRFNKQE